MTERRVVVGRAWLITIQAPKGSTNKWRAVIPEKWNGRYSYKCQCYEMGKEAKSIHSHILIYFKCPRRSSAIARDIIQCNQGSEVDIQLKKGTWEEARAYVLKQDETRLEGRIPVESGSLPNDGGNKRGNENAEEMAKEVKEILTTGNLEDVAEENPLVILKHPSGCKLLKEIVGKKSKKRTVDVTIVWGAAGTGKSTYVMQKAEKKWGEDVFHFTKVGGSKDSIWFNGYKGQKCVIMDDVWGRSFPFEYMLKILGNDPLNVEYKGGSEPAMWEEVYITSNYNPADWYGKLWAENEDAKDAFFRRVKRIIHVWIDENGETIWDVTLDQPTRIMKDGFKIKPNWGKISYAMEEAKRAKNERKEMAKEDTNIIEEGEKSPAPKRHPLLNIEQTNVQADLDEIYKRYMNREWDSEMGTPERGEDTEEGLFNVMSDDVENHQQE